jgi:hypothetical protein
MFNVKNEEAQSTGKYVSLILLIFITLPLEGRSASCLSATHKMNNQDAYISRKLNHTSAAVWIPVILTSSILARQF